MTTAQRARLVVALGVLNLVLASLAVAVGFGSPRQPAGEVAAATAAPSPVSSIAAIDNGQPRSTAPSLPTPGTPGASDSTGSPEPSPTAEPSPIPVPSGGIIVAERPTPPPAGPAGPTPDATTPAATPAPTARPQPTPTNTPEPTPSARPQPTPTAKPPPKPTPPPKPVVKPQQHPPCPGSVDGPPGHNKGQPSDQPCGKGKDKGGSNGGVVIVVPLALSAAVAGGRRRIARSLRRRPSAR